MLEYNKWRLLQESMGTFNLGIKPKGAVGGLGGVPSDAVPPPEDDEEDLDGDLDGDDAEALDADADADTLDAPADLGADAEVPADLGADAEVPADLGDDADDSTLDTVDAIDGAEDDMGVPSAKGLPAVDNDEDEDEEEEENKDKAFMNSEKKCKGCSQYCDADIAKEQDELVATLTKWATNAAPKKWSSGLEDAMKLEDALMPLTDPNAAVTTNEPQPGQVGFAPQGKVGGGYVVGDIIGNGFTMDDLNAFLPTLGQE